MDQPNLVKQWRVPSTADVGIEQAVYDASCGGGRIKYLMLESSTDKNETQQSDLISLSPVQERYFR
jgi:hypothetical protein